MHRKTPTDYHELAKKRGFRWLGPEVKDIRTKTAWECRHGHQWKARYNDIQQSRGCPICAGNIRKLPGDYHALAQERGILWIGPAVSNGRIKTSWECKHGHHWETTYGNIQQGYGCPYCSGKAPKISTDYHALAQEHGFRWVGPEVSNNQTKTVWECAQGHRWQAPYASIQQGHGCPCCAGIAPKTPADYYALAQEKGLHWLGSEAPNIKTKTRWECNQGHQWESRYNDIQQGHGCPCCANNISRTGLWQNNLT